MNYNDFLQELLRQLSPLFPENTIISSQQIHKNNDITWEALVIHEPGCNISPTIYLDSYYKQYKQGMSLDEICHVIYDAFMESHLNHSVDTNFFLNYENAKNRIVYQVINYDKNTSRLPTLPHIRYLDLAVVFYCMLQLNNGTNASILIHNDHLALWGIDFETLKKQAFDNTPRLLPAYIEPITSVIAELTDHNPQISGFLSTIDTTDPLPLYVLTNESQFYGAACMLYPELLKEFAQSMGSDLYILPSSIHEVLLLPTVDRDDDCYLSKLVKMVNEEQVPDTQILSDHAYYYSREKSAILL